MSNEKMQKIIEVLVEKITRMESDIFAIEYENEKLRAENKRLEELLTPTKK